MLNAYAKALTRITKKYLRTYQPTVIVVAGSIGKTSATQAITSVLAQKFAVRSTIKSYNVAHSLPLSVFAEELPSSKVGWLSLVPKLAIRARSKQPFDTLVLEIGTDHPGELAQFAYLQPTLGVVTAITPEHMEYFKTLDAVAKEELSITSFCKTVLVDKVMLPAAYRENLPGNVEFYGDDKYRITKTSRDGFTQTISLYLDGLELSDVPTNFVGEQNLHAVIAAATVAHALGLNNEQIENGIRALQPVSGRMRVFKGIQDSTILDDSYNASPEAVIAALDTLAVVPGKQKIALLGNMNELGDSSVQAHKTIGLHCDPKVVDLVITLGGDANTYLAEAARAAGCKVLSTDSPHSAGQLLRDHMKAGATILVKGSQNRVFAEEAIKPLLADPADAQHLVRQSPYWLGVKRRQFGDPPVV